MRVLVTGAGGFDPLPAVVDEQTPTARAMGYAAHKLASEILIRPSRFDAPAKTDRWRMRFNRQGLNPTRLRRRPRIS